MTSTRKAENNTIQVTQEIKVKRRLSRSPHPYHRQSISLSRLEASEIANSVFEHAESESSTERGTEADDEKGPILRGLPAPPLKVRKGWKGSRSPLGSTPAISPLASPVAGDDSPSYFTWTVGVKKSRTKKKLAQATLDEDARRRYQIRKRVEILRRLCEVMLLGAVGLIACHQAFRSGTLDRWRTELSYTSSVFFGLCAIYPIRMGIRAFKAGLRLQQAVRFGFHIPSRFDPGPLLYPFLIPLLISASLATTNESFTIPNMVLSLASLPQALIPSSPSYASALMHWAICLFPIGNLSTIARTDPSAAESAFYSVFNAELLSLLFPLHKTVVQILKYLTTTSLDPAEIQLLSVGVINLLFFAVSPQTFILRAFLWPGVVGLFVFCLLPLRLEINLARIPAWKFARHKRSKTGIAGKVDTFIHLFLPVRHQRYSTQLDSDDEDYEHLRIARQHARSNAKIAAAKTTSQFSDVELSERWNKNAGVKEESTPLRRVSTLPETGGRTKDARPTAVLSRTGLLSLTYAQAQALKWLIAAYVYVMVISMIFLALRPYIASYALNSHEPFGWALGYLFGDIDVFRFLVVSNNYEKWISLPQHKSQSQQYYTPGWIEHYRQVHIGPANMRLLLSGYCLVTLTLGLMLVQRLKSIVEVDTRRKVFHGVMVAMLLPTIPVDPCFVALALIIILSIFLLLDLFRASQLPPISRPLTAFLAPYVDGRDYRGPVIISHIFLLIGCAIPLILSLAGNPRLGQDPWLGWEVGARDLSMISGVVCVGMGDAAASLIGRRYGRTKWIWGGGKSIEGSCAFAVAVTIGLMASYLYLRVGGWAIWSVHDLPLATTKAIVAAAGASLLESVLTAANDNVVVPIGLWLLVRGLAI